MKGNAINPNGCYIEQAGLQPNRVKLFWKVDNTTENFDTALVTSNLVCCIAGSKTCQPPQLNLSVHADYIFTVKCMLELNEDTLRHVSTWNEIRSLLRFYNFLYQAVCMYVNASFNNKIGRAHV